MRLPDFSIRLFGAATLCLACLLTARSQAADTLNLVVPPFEYNDRLEARYFYQLLALALEKTAREGPFTIDTYPLPMSADRSIEELKRPNGLVNLMWNTPTPSREHDLLSVRVSLLRELNNYRVLLIRKEDQPLFSAVRSLDDLRRLRAGLGTQWPDTTILRASGLPVVTSLKHSSLFAMLSVKRFDYFPRGLYEVWSEITLPESRGLAIETSLMLYYDLPFYFYVNRQNTALASRLERGLRRAQADGSFDQLLRSVPSFRRGLDEQRNSRRRLFTLPAPPAEASSQPPAGPSAPRP